MVGLNSPAFKTKIMDTNEKKDELTLEDLAPGVLYQKAGNSNGGFYIKLGNNLKAFVDPNFGHMTISNCLAHELQLIVSIMSEDESKEWLIQMKEIFHMEYLDGCLTSSKCKDRLETLENQTSKEPVLISNLGELQDRISNQEDTITALSDEKDEALKGLTTLKKEISSLENDLSFQKNYAESLKLKLTQLKGALNILSK